MGESCTVPNYRVTDDARPFAHTPCRGNAGGTGSPLSIKRERWGYMRLPCSTTCQQQLAIARETHAQNQSRPVRDKLQQLDFR